MVGDTANIAFVFYTALAAVIGLLLGSFFNVLVWRMPRGESVISPRSRCPSCGRTIRAHENIPLLSFVLLRGRCAGCTAAISWRYPAVELLTGCATVALWLLVLWPAVLEQASPWLLALRCAQAALLLLLIPMSLIDLDHLIIPDAFTLPGLAIGLSLALLPGGITPLDSLLGALAGGGSLLFFGKLGELLFRKGEGMGGGDIKLMAWAGALWGWQPVLLAILFASFTGAIAGGLLFLSRLLPRDHRIPFGPFLGLGLWIAVLAGGPIVRWYLYSAESLFFR
ncbi:MAG: prepilin peptidase [Chitinivibrionales bacterium]|nr:prepilin peptidase [Chitinivibrionales bacterium]